MTTTGLFFDTRRPLQDGKFPLKLRITQDRKSRLYTIEINNQKLTLTPDEYEKISLIKPQLHFKELKKKINKVIEDAEEIITSIDDFTFEKFEQIYKKKTLRTVKDYFDDYSQALLKNKHVRTANLYEATYKSLTTYKSSLIDFRQITPTFLKDYETSMLDKEKTLTTVGMYLRNLRSIMNKALKDGLIKQSEYPFGKGKYIIPKGSSSKQILNQRQIKKIYHCKGLNPLQEKARDFWIFSYCWTGNGIVTLMLYGFFFT
jgi:hypothetical protein